MAIADRDFAARVRFAVSTPAPSFSSVDGNSCAMGVTEAVGANRTHAPTCEMAPGVRWLGFVPGLSDMRT